MTKRFLCVCLTTVLLMTGCKEQTSLEESRVEPIPGTSEAPLEVTVDITTEEATQESTESQSVMLADEEAIILRTAAQDSFLSTLQSIVSEDAPTLKDEERFLYQIAGHATGEETYYVEKYVADEVEYRYTDTTLTICHYYEINEQYITAADLAEYLAKYLRQHNATFTKIGGKQTCQNIYGDSEVYIMVGAVDNTLYLGTAVLRAETDKSV